MTRRRRSGRRALSRAVVALSAVLAFAPTALACPPPLTSQAFRSSGDGGQYAPIPGGSFEEGLTWSATGAPALVSESQPSEGASARAVALHGGDSITSPAVCIDRYSTYVRFTLRADESDSKLKLAVLWTGDDGTPRRTVLDDHDAKQYRAWGLSRIVNLKDAVPKGDAVRDIRLRFSVDGASPAWLVSNVQISYAPPRVCPEVGTTRAFGPWGDDADYAEMPGGSFEDGLTWTQTGSPELVAAGNPLEVNGVSSTAVLLRAADSITSPSICIDETYPTLRFVLRGMDPSSKLKLDVLWTGENGRPEQTRLDDHDAKQYGAWGLSRIVRLRDAVPRGEAVRDIRLRFSVKGATGAWLLDDVYIDPFRRG